MPDRNLVGENTEPISDARKRSLANLRPPWKPGETGNPGGRPRKPLRDALDKILKPSDLEAIARLIVKGAKKGDKKDLYELRDMLDGKPRQEISGPDGAAIPVTVEGIDDAMQQLIDELKNERNT